MNFHHSTKEAVLKSRFKTVITKDNCNLKDMKFDVPEPPNLLEVTMIKMDPSNTIRPPYKIYGRGGEYALCRQ